MLWIAQQMLWQSTSDGSSLDGSVVVRGRAVRMDNLSTIRVRVIHNGDNFGDIRASYRDSAGGVFVSVRFFARDCAASSAW